MTTSQQILFSTVLIIGAALIAGCGQIEPARISSKDKNDCFGCPPGLITGDDGVLTVDIPVDRGAPPSSEGSSSEGRGNGGPFNQP
ncbi:MAG: hypothetical protein ACFB6S_07165 [Geminicoccaceae bacterium]